MQCNAMFAIESYIAHPYWPEREKVITITKESGMARARSTANRRKCLQEYLSALDMSLADFDRLNELADRPWHTDDDGCVIVPKRSVDGMLTEAADRARAAFKAFPSNMARTACRATSWVTSTKASEALPWQRFVVVTAGTGAKLSNQRALRVNQYIGATPPDDTLTGTGEVLATATFEIDPDLVKPDVLRNMLTWAGAWVGIGASRKMGWGRFSVASWDVDGHATGPGGPGLSI